MASTNWTGFAPVATLTSFATKEPNIRTGYQGTLLPVDVGARDPRLTNAVSPLRVRAPIYVLRGQFGGVTETWLGSSPDTAPPSGHVLTEKSFIVIDT